MKTFRLTVERVASWHRYASEQHHAARTSACIICDYLEGRVPWSDVVVWLQDANFAVRRSEAGWIDIECLPDRGEGELYRLIAGRGDWV